MAELPTYFRTFLQNIRLSKSQSDNAKTGHSTLRERLMNDEDLSSIIVDTFLQGSYRRSTIIKPKSGKRSDVDVVVVTNLNESDCTPRQALEKFRPFLEDYYDGKFKPQGRSWGIELSYVDLDLVVTAAPSEMVQEALSMESIRSSDTVEEVSDWRLNEYWPSSAQREAVGWESRLYKAKNEAEWKTEPLKIPDRDSNNWELTDPIRQIQWTFEKNQKTSGHYVNIVKAIKWWARVHHPEERPKGYPLEHIIGDCCPDDDVSSVAQGVTETLEKIVTEYEDDVANERTPCLWDRGVDQDVMARITPSQFAEFYERIKVAAALAREALELEGTKSAAKWRELFGDQFPEAPDSKSSSEGGYTGGGPAVPPGGRFGKK